MKVFHLSTYDNRGGAARAAYRLHQGLRAANVDSSMFVRRKTSEDAHVTEWNPNRSLSGRLKEKFKRRWLRYRFQKHADSRPDGLELFSQARTLYGSDAASALPDADVYNLHWINEFIDPHPFFEAVEHPVVWTLHDMNPMTGGCHYNVGCRKFEKRCGRCPQLGSTAENDLSRSVWSRKRDAYHRAIAAHQLHIVADSKWLAREAQKSTLLSEAPIRTIHYGLDHHTFQPRETKGIHRALNIPQSHRILLFVAQSVRNHRKGFDLLTEALSSVSLEDVTLLSIGGKRPDINTSHPHFHLGTIDSNLLLSIFYSLADLFVIPSRQEAFGQTALESMACGTPVVGFDTGGIPDMVRPSETGWLADVGDVQSLQKAIEQALENSDDRKRMGERCREVVLEEYTLERQARDYLELYQNISR